MADARRVVGEQHRTRTKHPHLSVADFNFNRTLQDYDEALARREVLLEAVVVSEGCEVKGARRAFLGYISAASRVIQWNLDVFEMGLAIGAGIEANVVE